MYRVISCLVVQHDYRLVLLAAAICAATTFTSFSIYSRVAHAQKMMRLGWLFLTGVCTASGIWATHFVAMLAYNAGVQTAYDPVLTAGSLLVAIVATTLGYFVCSGRSPPEIAIGGGVVGIGIGLMHFTGMRALIVPGTIKWDATLVIVSLALGAALASAATTVFHRLENFRAIAAGAGLLTLGICGLHFTAMGAAYIEPDPTIIVEGFSADASVLALAIAGLTVLVMLAGLAAAVIDRQTSQNSIDRIRELVNAASEGIVIAADGIVINVNRRVSELCGQPADDLIGKRVGGELFEEIVFAPRTGSRTVEATLKTVDGKAVSVEVVCQPFHSGVRGNEVYAIRDLTERHRNEAKITHMAHHDALTDLPNRVLLAERLEQALIRAGTGGAVAVLCIDLDRFKEVNDALGHTIGDVLLKKVAGRLRSCIRETDTVARMGGDEFVILQSAPGQPVEATALATRIVEALSAPFVVKDHQMVVGASVGIALSPGDGTEPEQLLKNADIALYRAKSEGRGTYRFFEKGMDVRMQARRALEMDLRKALVNGEFELYYQPIHDLGRNELCGFEALLRWIHPQRGMVSPAEIIPLAEETGFIVPIGEWVLREACAEADKWPPHLKVAVNLSPKQFKSRNLVQAVVNAIVASGLNPGRLELEITETALLSDSAATLETLRKLQNFGVRIALDDFGTGYSSLSYLRSFPFNKIKIDQSFINGLSDGSEEAVAIVRAVTQMGLSLGMSTTAEGVETASQLDIVRAEGCTEVQGYLFSSPQPAREIARMIAAAEPTPQPEPAVHRLPEPRNDNPLPLAPTGTDT
jgi:diguanylate cyclase (GGDEF)-like protein/PAS domain S-box-containing protein